MLDPFSLIIVDDDPDLLRVLESFFSSEELPCRTFSRADQALQHLSESACQVMITDIKMPGMRGLEFTERAKRIQPDMNIIVMTGYIETFSYDDAMAAGASDFIRKPFSLNELMLRIKHVRLQEKLRTLSITDELTGLPNRRGFFALAEQQTKAALRSRRDLVLLFSDIDDFKTINDTRGHQAGDRALVAMADIFRKSVRDSDIVARMGGDEFAVLLLNTTGDNIDFFRERFRDNLSRFNGSQEHSFRLSASIGWALFDHADPSSIDELLRNADERMYLDKQQKKSANTAGAL